MCSSPLRYGCNRICFWFSPPLAGLLFLRFNLTSIKNDNGGNKKRRVQGWNTRVNMKLIPQLRLADFHVIYFRSLASIPFKWLTLMFCIIISMMLFSSCSPPSEEVCFDDLDLFALPEQQTEYIGCDSILAAKIDKI